MPEDIKLICLAIAVITLLYPLVLLYRRRALRDKIAMRAFEEVAPLLGDLAKRPEAIAGAARVCYGLADAKLPAGGRAGLHQEVTHSASGTLQ